MSSSDFKRVLIRDERLDAKDCIPFAVYKSGQNVTVAQFNAISDAPSSHTYNIQVPSETTILDRRVIWDAECTFQVSYTLPAGDPAIGTPKVQYGLTEALGPFPLHSMCSTIQVTINNNSVSTNMNDILPALLHFYDRRELNRYNGMTPTAVDTARNYSDFVGATNNVLGNAASMSLDNDFLPRGSFIEVQTAADALFTLAPGLNAAGANTYYVKFHVREPLLVSPFSYAHPYVNGQGFYGIQNLNFVMNLITDQTSGVWRSAASYASLMTISNVSWSSLKPSLIFNFLSPKPSDMLSARNVVPYWEMPRFLTTGLAACSAGSLNACGGLTYGSTTYASNTIQLNQIPDKLIIFLRRPKALRNPGTTDSSLFISRISVSFNNQSGILASATDDQLYRFSYEAGSNQSWQEYRAGAAQNSASGIPKVVAMSGSYLMLDMGRHIQITEDYYAPGSLGNFNLQFNIEAKNAGSDAYTPEMVLITLNSGLFVCEKGQSATYTGILTKDDVLSVSSAAAVNEREAARMVGGAFGLHAMKASSCGSGMSGGRGDAGAGAAGAASCGVGAGKGFKGAGKGAGTYNAIKDRLV